MVRNVRDGQTSPMTSESASGTAVPERAVAAVATVGALVLLVGVGLSARGPATADLPTVLLSASAGTVVVTEGGERPARAGDALPEGARVRTLPGGSAALGTDGRTVRLAPDSEVVVVDGARQRLERGSALVDAADGPGVRLTAARSTVTVAEDGVVRVDRERLLRVAAYRGSAGVRAPGRRRTVEVDRLHQLQVASGGLAGAAVPLALRADAWEREELPQLVEDDASLERTVRMLADAPTVVAAALPAAERSEEAPADVLAEQALAYALAHDDGDFDADTYFAVQEGRTLGGSWGVVAALAEASAAGAERFLAGSSDVEGLPAAVLAAGLPADLAGDVLGTLPGFTPDDDAAEGSEDGPAPTGSDPTSRPRPGSTPTSPAPEPSRGPVQEAVDTVVDTVEDALPVPLPVPVPTPPAAVRPPLADVEVEAPVVQGTVEETVESTVESTVEDAGSTVGRAVDGVVDGVVGGVLGR